MSHIPAYKEVYSKLKEELKEGIYPAGSLLPTESELEKFSCQSHYDPQSYQYFIPGRICKNKTGLWNGSIKHFYCTEIEPDNFNH